MRRQLSLLIFTGLVMVSGFKPAQVSAQYNFLFTQYMWNELAINPAYAGSRDALSVLAVYRNQWVGVQGAPSTTGISANAPILNYKVGVGINYIHDEIGISKSDYFNLSYSYRLKFTNSNLSLGLSAMLITQKDLYSQLITNDTDPLFLTDSPRVYMPNASFGAYYFSDSYYFGFSIPRLVRNELSDDANFKVTNRFDVKYFNYYFTAGSVFNLSNGLKLQPTALLLVTNGSPVKASLVAQLVIRDTFWFGGGWNSGDGFTALASVYLTPQFRIGYSYDYTTSQLSSYSKGTHEITIGYDFNLGTKRIVSPRFF